MSHIFISYSHKDKAYVHKLQEALQAEGFDVWIDDRIDHGTTWPIVIQKNLDACSAFIVIMTENAFGSRWVHNEVTRAERKGKPFFALLLEGDTWLSFEAVQYESVIGGRLPSQKFYDALAGVVSRRGKPPVPHLPSRRKVPVSWEDVKGWLTKSFPAIRYTGFLLITAAIVWAGIKSMPTIISWIQTATPTSTTQPSPMLTKTAGATSTVESVPDGFVDGKGALMTLVPATTHMDSFYIDVYEVSNAEYKNCQICDLPVGQGPIADPDLANHPVVHVTWDMAKKFCEWRDARLPTRNEWKLAAYGDAGDRVFPWGDAFGCDKANYGSCIGRTSPVDSFENGVSPFGIYNSVGNVWEWVDQKDASFAGYYVILGGSYESVLGDVNAEKSASNQDIYSGLRDDIGFRCAKDAP